MNLSRLTNEQLATIAATQQPGAGVAEALLVERNRGLIGMAAKRWGYGLDREDAWAVAAYGFIVAVRKFDPTRAQLTTHAMIWMRQKLGSYHSESSRIIRIPRGVEAEANSVRRAWEILGRDADERDLMKATGLTLRPLRRVIAAMEQAEPLSLDAPVKWGAVKNATIAEMVGGGTEPEAVVLAGVQPFALDCLTSRECTILTGRMDGQTLDEIGQGLGISRERVRQILAGIKGKIAKSQEITEEKQAAAIAAWEKRKKESQT